MNIARNPTTVFLLSFLLWLCFFLMPDVARSAPVPEHQVKTAVETWLRHVTADAKPDAVIEKLEPYQVDGRTFAYIAHIAGGGFSLCGASDSLNLPVYLYSPSGKYDPQNPGYQSVLKTITLVTIKLEKLIENNDPQLQEYSADLDLRTSLWRALLEGELPLQVDSLITPSAEPLQMALPLTTNWDQGPPYNNFAPMGDGGRSLVGCVATTMAQIMRYWQWPPSGAGSSSYIWDGDQSCGGSVGGGLLSAVYSDSYDWQNMLDNCTDGCTVTEQFALAELSYEIGVSVTMDYGVCVSGSDLWRFVTETEGSPLINNFLYDGDAVYNSDIDLPHTDDGTIITEIQWSRPVALGGCLNTGGGHAWVVLGYNNALDPPQFLMNMGWGGVDVWSTRDNVAGCHNYITQIAPADSVRFVGNTVAGDGSPDNPHENIEEAIQQAPNNATLILKAGSVNAFDANVLVITKPLILKGHNSVIE